MDTMCLQVVIYILQEDGISNCMNIMLIELCIFADVFKIFKDDDGQFFCAVATKDAHFELRSMLSFHRASEIVFPGETILKEANIFTSKYLQHALKDWNENKVDKNRLIMEVIIVLFSIFLLSNRFP